MPSAILRGSLALFVLSSTAWGESTTINGVTYDSKGSAAVTSKDALGAEQALRLKKVFLFPSMDDLSGALAPKLDEKLAQLFMRNSRFELIRDPQVVKALSPDEKSYYKAAVSGSVHREAAKVTGADTTVLLRTHNVGPNTQMNLELRDANGNLLFSEEGSVPGSATMEARWALIDKLYSGMLKRLPFEGAITGRTANTITVDLGMGAVRQGEEVDIARIVSVQRHPLLGTVVGTDYVRTGRAKITSVDRVLSFAEVIEETAGEKIAPGQKVLQARAVTVRRGSEKENESGEERTDSRYERPGQTRPLKKSGLGEEDPFEDRLKGEFDRPRPRYGFVGGNLYYGSLGYTQNTTDYGGSGIGGDLNGELWVSKSWILSLLYGFQNANLSAQGTELGSTSFKNFQVVGGFRIFPESVAEGFVLTG